MKAIINSIYQVQEGVKSLDEATDQIKTDLGKSFSWLNGITEKLISAGFQLLVGVGIFIIGFWLAGKITKLIQRRMIARKVDYTIISFLVPIINILLKILVAMTAINTMGIQVTSFAAMLGGAAVAIGLALQGSLSNFASGILIILFKPFKVGDFVELSGKSGTVESISILNTIIVQSDLKTVILPNATVFNNPITNYSVKHKRRLSINIGIAYEDDFEKVQPILRNVLETNQYVIKEDPITVEINNFGDSSVNLDMICFVNSADYYKALYELNKNTKKAMDNNGYSIPYPQTEMHIKGSDGTSTTGILS